MAAIAAGCALAIAAAPALGHALLWLSLALLIAAIARPAQRSVLLRSAAALLWSALAALAFAFVTDRFSLRAVWLYSSPELPAHLKLANVWSGDEGVTLMLATFCTSLAARASRVHCARALAASAAIAAWYVASTLWLAPFAPTPAAWLAQSSAQGMHAHLMKIWMVFHAPLLIAAYAWTLALAGPALAALKDGTQAWPALAHAHARRAWAVLSAGIGAGMIWAFEDAMYGQAWHWDPVQTAVFSTWCFLTAHLHGVIAERGRSGRARRAPLAALLAAGMTAAAMAVTRNPLLASSHRYVDADTWISHLALAAALLLAGAACWATRRRCAARSGADGMTAGGGAASAARQGLQLTQWGFLVAGALAAAQLLYAFLAAAAEWPRPDAYKPFLGLLASMTHGAELEKLRAAFEQWDVDGYALAQHLLLPATAIGLVGGWYFLRRISARLAWASLALATLASASALFSHGGLHGHYAGAGILSQRIVALLPRLDALLVSGSYLAIACIAWAASLSIRNGWRAAAATVPTAALHVGIVLMLWGGLLSTALNGYSQHEVDIDASGSAWQLDRQGYRFRLRGLTTERTPDGGVRTDSSIRALTTIEVGTPSGQILDGQTLYRDSRAPLERLGGPLRQVCELLDYRYARHVSTKGYLLQPMIDHGWAATVQFWVSPGALAEAAEGRVERARAVVVIKVFPFSSLLWSGLVLSVASALWLAFRPLRRPARTRARAPAGSPSAARRPPS